MKKIIIILLLITLNSSCVKTGLGTVNTIAKLGHFKSIKNIAYGKNELNFLNLYLPKNKVIKATIIFYYGGCWGYCSDLNKDNYLFIADTLSAQGYAVVIPDYRVYPKVNFSTIIEDAKNATLWTLSNLDKYDINTDKVFIMGHSAGAHIGAMLVNNETFLGYNLTKIAGFIGLAGPYDFYPFNGSYMYELFDKSNDYYASQPIHFVNGNEPPHLLLHGKEDTRVNPLNADHLSTKLTQFNIPNQLVEFDGMSHAKIIATLARPLRKNSKVLESINAFIQKY